MERVPLGCPRRESCFVEPLPDAVYKIFLPSFRGMFVCAINTLQAESQLFHLLAYYLKDQLSFGLQAGLFFLKHAEKLEKDLPAKELLEMLLLSLQWLSGIITQSNP